MRSPLFVRKNQVKTRFGTGFLNVHVLYSFCSFGPVAQLGERAVRIREVRGFDPLRVHQEKEVVCL